MPINPPGSPESFAVRIRDLFLNNRFGVKTTHKEPVRYETPTGTIMVIIVADPVTDLAYELSLRQLP